MRPAWAARSAWLAPPRYAASSSSSVDLATPSCRCQSARSWIRCVRTCISSIIPKPIIPSAIVISVSVPNATRSRPLSERGSAPLTIGPSFRPSGPRDQATAPSSTASAGWKNRMSWCAQVRYSVGSTMIRGSGGIGGAPAAEVIIQNQSPRIAQASASEPAAIVPEISPARAAAPRARRSRRPWTASGPVSSSGSTSSGYADQRAGISAITTMPIGTWRLVSSPQCTPALIQGAAVVVPR